MQQDVVNQKMVLQMQTAMCPAHYDITWCTFVYKQRKIMSQRVVATSTKGTTDPEGGAI